MEFFSAVCWLAACFFLAVTARLCFHFERLRFVDGAFSLYMGLGMALSFLPVWFVCSLTGLIFNSVTVLGGILILAGMSFMYRYKKGCFHAGEAGSMDIDGHLFSKRFLLGFLLFALLFAAAVFVKGYNPIIDHQTEQYMDYGFMKVMYRQQELPFEDFWAAGGKVNYYYLGQAAAVFICRLSFVSPDYGYSFMLCTVFAGLTMAVFSLVQAFLSSFDGMKRSCSVFGGIVSALLSSCGGNGHYIIYGIFKQIYNKVFMHDPDYSYWFPSSTLFIGYDPDTLDKAKHEFPSYTLVLGDLHAHVLNMIFVIVLLAVLSDYILIKNEKQGKGREYLSPHILLMGLLLGLFKGVNYWDFPIYYVVCGAVILFTDLKKQGLSLYTIVNVLIKGLVIYLTGMVLMLPFSLQYKVPASGIHLCDRHSPVSKLLIIWFPFFISAFIILKCTIRRLGDGKSEEERRCKDKGKDQIQLLAVLAMTLCALGLILMPEIVYVKDIYGDEFERYNTMFKLTFQAFIILSLVTGTGTGLLLNEGLDNTDKVRGKSMSFISAVLISCLSFMLISYMPWSVRAWFGDITRLDLRPGASVTGFMDHDPAYDDVRDAIRIINADARRRVHIIEEAGNSYSPENRLSVFTGAVAVSGWYVHEWVWRNDSKGTYERHEEVRNFYESGDIDYCRKLAGKYDLDYIYVGSRVMEKYCVDPGGFSDLGEKVWENGDEGWMLIRVDKEQ